MSDVVTYKRGQVWIMKDDIKDKSCFSGSSVQRGTRPVLIFSSDRGNKSSSTVIILKITSHSEKGQLAVNVPYTDESGKPNVILCNQIATIDKSDLIKYIYTISDSIMDKVEAAHKIATDTSATQIDDKIDKIYKILEDLSVIKSNAMHNTSKDEKVIEDVASELQRLYADMSKYHDSTVAELKNSIPAINDHNAKLRMGLSKTNSEVNPNPSVADDKSAVDTKVVNSTSKPRKRKPSTSQKPKGYWTEDRIKEFVVDKSALTFNDWMEKYEYTDRKAIMKAYYTYSSKLNRMK